MRNETSTAHHDAAPAAQQIHRRTRRTWRPRRALPSTLLAALVASSALVTPGLTSAPPVHAATTPIVFDQPGEHSWTVPTGVTRVTLDVAGAQGGAAPGGAAPGGKGGRAAATFRVEPGWLLRINVGGKGGDGPAVLDWNEEGGAGGYYGGAHGGGGVEREGGGGGGATRATFDHSWDQNHTGLFAGGGGGAGAGEHSWTGGGGGSGGGAGGTSGATGNPSGHGGEGGGGATETSGGKGYKGDGDFLKGAPGDGGAYGAGGGGGGYYGGGGGQSGVLFGGAGGGGGGAGYSHGYEPGSLTRETGVQAGNGKVVITIPTTVTLSSSLNPSKLSQAVTFTARVWPATASGQMRFTQQPVGQSTPSTITDCEAQPITNGVATCTMSRFSTGPRDIVAQYLGNGAYTTSASPAIRQVVSPYVANGTYRLTALHSGKVLEVYGGSMDYGAPVAQWDWHGGPNQQWVLAEQPDGSYKLTAKHSGKVLEVYGGWMNDDAPVAQWSWHGGPNQRWYLIHAGTGAYRLMAVHSGKTLQVQGGSLTNGATVVQGFFDMGAWAEPQEHRRWALEPVP